MEQTTFFKDYQNLIDSFETLKKSEDNPFFKSKYVPLKVILPIVKEKCKEFNFVLIQTPLIVEGKNTLVTKILHESGIDVTGSIEIVAKDATDPQKVGAGLTYMRRYMLTCMFGLEEEDDDGNTASNKKTEKTETLEKPGFCNVCGEQAVKSPKSGRYFCPSWKEHTAKKEAYKIVQPSNATKEQKELQDELDNIK